MSNSLTIKIAMVGPSRVGKTSLLASMSAHIHEEVKKSKFQFKVSGQSNIDTLNQRRAELKQMATCSGITVDLLRGPQPSQEERKFEFKLSKVGSTAFPTINFHFVDIPGAWYLGKGEASAADQLLKEADVIIVAVDSVLLLEAKGKYHEKANCPETICDGILTSCTNREEGTPPPLVLVVCVKAESYLWESSSKEGNFKVNNLNEKDLRDAIRKSYENLRELKPAGIVARGCAIETVGNIVFNHIREDELGNPVVAFRRIPGKEYSPRHCSVPLRLTLEEVLKRTRMVIGPETTIDKIRAFFGFESDRTAALNELISLLDQLSKETSDGKTVNDLVFEI